MTDRQGAHDGRRGCRPALLVLLAVACVAGCRRQAAGPPAEPMLAAIGGDQRAAGLTYAESQGRLLFQQYCATCHGDEGKGDGQNASNLDPAPPDLTAPTSTPDPAYLRRVIALGSAAAGRSPLSPPWGRSLRAQEIDDLVLYCRALARRKPGQLTR
jgi:mono/diheme cytochrome c family protein